MKLCPHIQPGPVPWDVLLVLDDHLGPTDALTVCRTCGTPYLIEMLDWRHPLRLFRIYEPRTEAVQGLLRNLERGSCDIRRAGEEVRHFAQGAERLPWLVLLDTDAHRVVALVDHPGPVPGASWRELPCDGSLIDETGTQAARL